jgi:hypothetical protein
MLCQGNALNAADLAYDEKRNDVFFCFFDI